MLYTSQQVQDILSFTLAGVSKHLTPTRAIVNGPATIVFFADGSKQICKLQDGDEFNLEHGILMCIAKQLYKDGNDVLRELIKTVE